MTDRDRGSSVIPAENTNGDALPAPHEHFGYWINRETGAARCYECGFQFIATDSTAEEWVGGGWQGEARLHTTLLPAAKAAYGADALVATLATAATITLYVFTAADGVPVVQIDTDPTVSTGPIRVNLNDAPIWYRDPEES